MHLKEIQSCWSCTHVCDTGASGSSMIGFISEESLKKARIKFTWCDRYSEWTAIPLPQNTICSDGLNILVIVLFEI